MMPRLANYYVVPLVLLPAAATIYGIVQLFTGSVGIYEIVMMLALGALTEFGVTFGYHRMVVHKAFTAHPILKAIVLAFGSMAFQGPVINWASVHTKHHAMSDQEGDPHTPTFRGFIFAHFEWLIEMTSTDMAAIRSKYESRYTKDPMLVWFDKTFLLWSAFSLILPFLLGGWQGLLWGGLIRIFLTSHVTWSVNSVCHIVGGRMFKTTDQSRNNFIVGLLALGEGWHNNHHAFPSSAFHGLRWWQIDITAYMIRIFEKVGLVSGVVRIPTAYLSRQIALAQDKEAP
ncbi:MAG: acyl-CoA desaturase ['Candidatus Kapabacteria' thiocyanatum]|nr:acyl-CoA desaturase ['Candidatus Kapabacteria' thiocyanatum]